MTVGEIKNLSTDVFCLELTKIAMNGLNVLEDNELRQRLKGQGKEIKKEIHDFVFNLIKDRLREPRHTEGIR